MYLTVSIHFEPDRQSVWALRFILKGFPAGPRPVQKEPPPIRNYTHKEIFNVPYLALIVPTNEIIIVMSNHPNVLAASVRWLGLENLGPEDLFIGLASRAIQALFTSGKPQMLSADAIAISISVRGFFTIKEALRSSFTSSLDGDYNPYHLKLNGISVLQGSLVWNFKAIEVAETQIIVDIISSRLQQGERGQALICTVCNVIVGYTPNALTNYSGHSSVTGANFATDGTRAETPDRVTFLRRVDEALEIAWTTAPEAEIVDVLAAAPWIIGLCYRPGRIIRSLLHICS